MHKRAVRRLRYRRLKAVLEPARAAEGRKAAAAGAEAALRYIRRLRAPRT